MHSHDIWTWHRFSSNQIGRRIFHFLRYRTGYPKRRHVQHTFRRHENPIDITEHRVVRATKPNVTIPGFFFGNTPTQCE